MNNLIVCADLHITSKRPLNRIDNYFETVLCKFEQIIKLCNDTESNLIIAGDIFDSSNVGHKVVNSILRILNKMKYAVYVVAGQHDMVNHKHSDLIGSPLLTLIESGKCKLLGKDPIKGMYGVSFGQEVPEIKYKKSNILVIHKSITKEDPPFYLEDAISGEDAFDEYSGYGLIIAGDFHSSFVMKMGERILINCGPMMRNKIDYINYAPKVHLIKLDKKQIVPLRLEFKDSEYVFKIIEAGIEGAFSSEDFDNVVNALKQSAERPSFKKVTYSILAKLANKKVTNKANEIMGRVYDRR